MNDKLTVGVAVIVTAVWSASFTADIFLSSYDPSPFIHLMMMTIVGALFGKQFIPKTTDDKKIEEKQ